jgi:hypothetical protein
MLQWQDNLVEQKCCCAQGYTQYNGYDFLIGEGVLLGSTLIKYGCRYMDKSTCNDWDKDT